MILPQDNSQGIYFGKCHTWKIFELREILEVEVEYNVQDLNWLLTRTDGMSNLQSFHNITEIWSEHKSGREGGCRL